MASKRAGGGSGQGKLPNEGRLLILLRSGVPLDIGLAAVGLPADTKPSTKLQRAEDEGQANLIRGIAEHRGDWRAAAWLVKWREERQRAEGEGQTEGSGQTPQAASPLQQLEADELAQRRSRRG